MELANRGVGLLGAVAVLLGAAGGLGQERAEAGKSQSIIVEKVTIPGGALQLFTFDPSWGPDFMLADGQSETPVSCRRAGTAWPRRRCPRAGC